MARRKYQTGYVFQKGKTRHDPWDADATAFVQFWRDVPEGPKRRDVVSLGPCRTRTIAERTAAERLEILGVNTTRTFIESTSSVTFQQQGEEWLRSLATRKRNPLEKTTIENRKYTLDKWLYPRIGSMMLSSVTNKTMKDLVNGLDRDKLSAATIRDYTQIVKSVIASAVDDHGEELFPRKWNKEYIDAPLVQDQHQPTVDAAGVESILRESGSLAVLYGLLAGCGPLRIGEALGLEIRHISADYRTLKIEQKAKRGEIQPYLKTKNGEREIDLCLELAELLRSFIGTRSTGLVFSSSTGRQLNQGNLLHDQFHPLLKKLGLPKGGFNMFRRFRMKHVEMAMCPPSLQHFWSGHAQTHISERYVKLLESRAERQEWAEKIGMGFMLPDAKIHLMRKSA